MSEAPDSHSPSAPLGGGGGEEAERLYEEARALPREARAAFVEAACRDDPRLRDELISLLEHADAAESLFDRLGAAVVSPLAEMAGEEARAGPGGGSLPGPTVPSWERDRLVGRTIGHYEIQSRVGRGGMATVYLARDTRHRRSVAVKVLRPELSAALGPERFLREIEIAARLQHPHILPLFDSGQTDSVPPDADGSSEVAGPRLLYYVMPYVEGETLRQRLAREGQLGVEEAVRLAREVADALDYAHKAGIIHRDIKPENILLQGGHALVADFGIALAVEQAGGERMTRTGLSLGTPQYMAPEQATGERVIDARADVYALGAVLYEMLAGEPPFTGPTAQAIVARMMTGSPRPLTEERPSVPAHVHAAVHTALSRLPADRFPSAAAFAAALAPPAPGTAPVPHARRPRRPWRAAALAAGGVIAGVAIGWALAHTTPDETLERRPVRFAIERDSAALRFGAAAMAPDGRTLVYAAEGADGTRLYARRLDELAARPLPGTEGGDLPFFSPDGAWVGFYSNGALRKVRLGGGAPVVVTQLPSAAEFDGGSWGADGVILYAGYSRGAVYRVSANGGTPSRLVTSDTTVSILHPHLLPGGRAALVTVTQDETSGRVAALELATGRLHLFGPGAGARYVGGSMIYLGPGGELFRQPFDLGRLQPTGSAEQIASGLDPLGLTLFGAQPFDASPTGALVYHAAASVSDAGNLRLVLTDRAGRELRAIPARMPWAPRFSPDGGRVAYGAFAPGRDSSDVWITDLRTGTTQRVTTDGNDNNDPQWSPNGRSLAFSANAPGGKDILVQPLSGGTVRRFTRDGSQWPSDWTVDGDAVLFTDVSPDGARDIGAQPLDGSAPRVYSATPAREGGARLSPDGRWVTYMSDETGRREVYVQSYPTPGRKTLVSTGGGGNPVWGPGGRELYYWQFDQLIVARVSAGGADEPLAVRDRTTLFRAPYFSSVHAMYDVSRDGTRFIIVTGGTRAGRLVVALDALRADHPRRAQSP